MLEITCIMVALMVTTLLMALGEVAFPTDLSEYFEKYDAKEDARKRDKK